MSDLPTPDALRTIARSASRLRTALRFEWPPATHHAVLRILLDERAPNLPQLVGIVGGASSGKSTLFNNLLEGHEVSRVTVRGHITLGPILACHERNRSGVEQLLAEGALLPGFEPIRAELDDRLTGEPERLAVVYHSVDPLADVLLLDLPDFTSESARTEGDITLALLPWLDRLLMVVDHERWFDRQSFTTLRAESVRFGQQRWVLFNRTREGELSDDDRRRLRQQSERLDATGATILEFRRGRGFRRFPPGTLDEPVEFLARSGPRRQPQLLDHVARCANDLLNQNQQRRAARDKLQDALRAVVDRTLPSRAECMAALMTAEERRQLEVLWRALRVDQTRVWLAGGTRRLYGLLRQVPLLGTVLPRAKAQEAAPPPQADRVTIGTSYVHAMHRRQSVEVGRVAAASVFWDEIRRWTGLAPPQLETSTEQADRAELESALRAFDAAVSRWNAKVESECHGLGPHLRGAAGLGALGLLIVLFAAPGPVTALTLVAAKGAVGAALGQLVAASGAGAVFGKHLHRFVTAAQEKLIGSPEFNAVQDSADAVRAVIETRARRLADTAVSHAAALVLPGADPLHSALDHLRAAANMEPT
jgi:hypothetical protein